jgi:hypothetical protein
MHDNSCVCFRQAVCLGCTYNAESINASKVDSTLTELYVSHTGICLLQDSQTYVIFLHRIQRLVFVMKKTVFIVRQELNLNANYRSIVAIKWLGENLLKHPKMH